MLNYKKKISNCDKYMKLLPYFLFCVLLVKKFAQILKYFAQSCDCMISAFRISGQTNSVKRERFSFLR